MSLKLAWKAFCLAWKHPEKAREFVDDKSTLQSLTENSDPSHLQLLSLLQQAGRLVDFLKEDIQSYSDAQVGAAVRKIHADCRKSLEEVVTIRPILEEHEGAKIQVPKGYDPSVIKVVGNVKGEPPFSGILVHKGWKAHKRSLPKKFGQQSSEIICPAEVEIK